MEWRLLKSKFIGLNIAEKIATIHALIYALSLLLEELIFPLLKKCFTLPVLPELLERPWMKLQYYFALPASFYELLQQPWALFTYSFFHTNISHLLFNSFFLIMIGHSFLNLFSRQAFLRFYFLGAFGAASIYLIGANVCGVTSGYLYGSSAATMAVFFALVTYQPNKAFFLPFVGSISLKNIAILILIIDLMSLSDGPNTRGNLSYLGSAATGFLYMKLFEMGRDILNPSYWRIKWRNKKQKFTAPKTAVRKRKKIDKILEKIFRSGYKTIKNGKNNSCLMQNKKTLKINLKTFVSNVCDHRCRDYRR